MPARRHYDQSLHYLGHTCVDVDSIFDDTARRIKDEVTKPFREALAEACQKIEDLEDKVGELEDEKLDLERQLEEASQTILELRQELENCQ